MTAGPSLFGDLQSAPARRFGPVTAGLHLATVFAALVIGMASTVAKDLGRY